MSRYFVTGTDTDVGKTRVSAALARALVLAGERPTIVKLVQTGVAPGECGDAERAGALAGCAFSELARYARPADPWGAALADGREPLRAHALAARLDAFAEPLVVEGSGGAAVPLNASETIADVARLAGAAAIVAVGLRLGCISHTLLTLAYLEARAIPVEGVVLVDRLRANDYAREDVERALAARAEILGTLAYRTDEAASVEEGARLFARRTATDRSHPSDG